MVDRFRKTGGKGNSALTADEISDLARRHQNGDRSALDLLLRAHGLWLDRMARRYARYGASFGDLRQEGALAFMRAVSRFDGEGGAPLAAFAGWWVRSAMQDHVIRSWSLVRVGTTEAQRRLFFRVRRTARELTEGSDGSASDAIDDLLKTLGERTQATRAEIVQLARRLVDRDRSLDEPGRGALPAEAEGLPPTPETVVAARREGAVLRRLLADALGRLPTRERQIIERRHLNDARISFASLAHEMQLSKERVRQLEKRAIGRLRAHLAQSIPRLAAGEQL